MDSKEARHDSKTKILNAALHVIRARGYSATRIEDVCESAGLTKGGFFHHFKGKEDLALAAANYWCEITGALFEAAEYHKVQDPVERILAYVDFRKALLQGNLPDYTCLVGTMVQEVYDTHPAIRDACLASISGHAATLEQDFGLALQARGIASEGIITPRSLALHTQAVIQGAFILAKATGSPEAAADSIEHLRRYLELIFQSGKKKEK